MKALHAILGTAVLAIGMPFVASDDQGEKSDSAYLALTNATLIDGTGAATRPNVTIVIAGGRIAEIHDGTAGEPPPDADHIDLSGRYVLPGLIDAHVHVSTAPDPEATLGAMLDAGVTTVRDMGGDARTLAVLARDAKIGAIRSPEIHYSANLFGPPFLEDPRGRRAALGYEPGTAPWARAVTADSDWRQVVAEARGTGATGLKLYAALEPELLQEIVREAHRQGLKVWSHATIFPSRPGDAVAAGVDVISHGGGLYAEARSDVPATYVESRREWLPRQDFAAVDPAGPAFDELFALMRRQGTLLEPTLAVLRHLRDSAAAGTPEAARRVDFSALSEWACAATRAAHEAGVMIVAGTDSWIPVWSISMATELEALVECGLSPLEAIQAATLNAARAIGIEETHGTVEAGKAASLVVLAADPTEDIGALRTVESVFRRGQHFPRADHRADRTTADVPLHLHAGESGEERHAQIQSEVQRLVRVMYEALEAADCTRVSEFFGEGFSFYVNGRHIASRERVLTSCQQVSRPFPETHFAVNEVRPLSENSALSLRVMDLVAGTIDGKPRREVITQIWRRDDDGPWRVSHMHVSINDMPEETFASGATTADVGR